MASPQRVRAKVRVLTKGISIPSLTTRPGVLCTLYAPPSSTAVYPSYHLPKSGPGLSPDDPFWIPSEPVSGSVSPLSKISPLLPYFCNRTILTDLIKAISCPDLISNGFLVDPKNRGRFWGFYGRLWALYGAQIWRILAKYAIKTVIFHAN
jgi:hypothetical protein